MSNDIYLTQPLMEEIFPDMAQQNENTIAFSIGETDLVSQEYCLSSSDRQKKG